MVGGSDGSMNRCATIGRERVASLDDVNATTLKENKKEKEKKEKYKFTVYRDDEHKKELNVDCCTNLVGVPVLGRVMFDPLRSRSLLAPFSTTRLSIK